MSVAMSFSVPSANAVEYDRGTERRSRVVRSKHPPQAQTSCDKVLVCYMLSYSVVSKCQDAHHI